jgi:hypothetical protein
MLTAQNLSLGDCIPSTDNHHKLTGCQIAMGVLEALILWSFQSSTGPSERQNPAFAGFV